MTEEYPKSYKNKWMLTDYQYFTIIHEIKRIVSEPNFKIHYYDSTTIGDKYTESNCGFCADDVLCTSKDRAKFPHQWPERKDMKDLQDDHWCPFDMRVHGEEYEHRITGCFYSCALFKYHIHNPAALLDLVNATIEKIKQEWGGGND